MSIFIGIIVGIVALLVLVVVHELGHFIAARKSGVEVEEFGIGIPPRMKAWKLKSGMEFSLNWLPIGGFCKMKGESDDAKEPGSFGAASFWGKTKILFSGVVMNWMAAWLILMVVAIAGMPHFLDNQYYIASDAVIVANPVVVRDVVDGSPAYWAGLRDGHQIISIAGEDIIQPADVNRIVQLHLGQVVKINYSDPKEETSSRWTETELADGSGEYVLGVSTSQEGLPVYKATWSAPIVAAVTTVQVTGETVYGVGSILYNLVSGVFKQVNLNEDVRNEGAEEIGQAGDGVAGPVGIVGVIFPAFYEAGFINLLFLVAIISISLAVMNLLPIPALDGGRWLLIAFYRIRGKELPKEKEEKIVGISFICLLGLAVLITVIDVFRLVSW